MKQGPTPTIVFETYWRFAAERQAIFFRRLAGIKHPWTNDPILAQYKFTNAYRASDRTSQYLIKNVIYNGDQSFKETFFRTILFKLFNKSATWKLLADQLKAISYCEFSLSQYDRILTNALDSGVSIYSGAYIMPTGRGAARTERKHRAHLALLNQMMKDDLPRRILDTTTMQEAFFLLRSYQMIGDFLAYQYITDLNYGPHLQFSESEFVVAGPGARSGIRKCFPEFNGVNESEIIRRVADDQEIYFARLGLNFQRLWGRRLQYIDCQNLFCEVDKYARVRHPELSFGRTRKRIKQRFTPTLSPVAYWYPPKWGMNGSALGNNHSA